MTEQGLWPGRKTGIKAGCLGSSFDIVFLGHLLNRRMEVKIHETCLLCLEWSICSPCLLKFRAAIIVILAITRATMLLNS